MSATLEPRLATAWTVSPDARIFTFTLRRGVQPTTALHGHPQVVVQKSAALNISYLSFNMKKPPVDRREVREALDIAIDLCALFKVLFPRGDALQAVSAFPPAVPGFNKRLRNVYNPERAQQLLAVAGVKLTPAAVRESTNHLQAREAVDHGGPFFGLHPAAQGRGVFVMTPNGSVDFEDVQR